MWNRSELKANAKIVLRKVYWTAFLVSLIAAIVNGGLSFRGYNYNSNDFNSYSYNYNGVHSYAYANPNLFGKILSFLIVFSIVSCFMIIFALAFRIFVSAVVEAGAKNYYLNAKFDKGDISDEFAPFRKGRYMNTVKSMVWRDLFTFLWTLLFIIPGIVKAYAYFMVPYIISDNPNIGYRQALKLSMNMTKGHKWNMFVLSLSFLGWSLLGLCACCVGVLFLMPYIEATFAELYIVLRGEAIEKGLCTEDELNITTAVVN